MEKLIYFVQVFISVGASWRVLCYLATRNHKKMACLVYKLNKPMTKACIKTNAVTGGAYVISHTTRNAMN